MPTEHRWVPPEVCVKTPKGTIYHAYKDEDPERVLDYWYTTDRDENPDWEFDIRELPTYGEGRLGTRTHKTILRLAAQRGEIAFPEIADE